VLLRVAARVELVTLLVLLANLVTVHAGVVATLIGPLHGCAYLLVIGSTLAATGRVRPRLLILGSGVEGLLAERQLRNARLLSLVPGVGGLLAERQLRTARPAV